MDDEEVIMGMTVLSGHIRFEVLLMSGFSILRGFLLLGFYNGFGLVGMCHIGMVLVPKRAQSHDPEPPLC